eukprot:455746-Hanusia_phi.AAC.3
MVTCHTKPITTWFFFVASTITQVLPADAAARAAVNPVGPPPITTRSYSSLSILAVRTPPFLAKDPECCNVLLLPSWRGDRTVVLELTRRILGGQVGMKPAEKEERIETTNRRAKTKV